jgi:NADP-dependent 3-hydroxy acid dehydrogenase YdfG
LRQLTSNLLGIGLAVAQYLLSTSPSHNLVVVARSYEPLRRLKEEYPNQVEVLNGDLADMSLADKAVNLALSTFGRLDGLVLNHGTMGQVCKIAATDPEQWKRVFDVNFISLVAFVSPSWVKNCR